MIHHNVSSASASPLAGHQWVVFGPDWGRYPSVSQHLFSQFIGMSPIIWVETVGLRTPRLSRRDFRRSFQKLADFVSRRRRFLFGRNGQVKVVTPVTLPFTRWKAVRLFNLWQVKRAVAKATRKQGFDNFTVVVTVPSQCDFVGRLGERLSIYYCMDNYSIWPGMHFEHVQRMEDSLISKVDAIIVSSRSLVEKMRDRGPPVHLLAHGVDVEHFQADWERATTPAAVFEVVYFGLIDERVDQELVVSLAQALPQAVVRLLGPVTVDVSRLSAAPNIHLESEVDYSRLPQAVKDAGVFILPFELNELAMSCSPIKIKEYLACGRPVLSTALPEVKALADLIHIARDRDEFVSQAVAAADNRLAFDRQKVAAFLADESWHSKAIQFAEIASATGAR